MESKRKEYERRKRRGMRIRYWITRAQIERLRNTTMDGGEKVYLKVLFYQEIKSKRGVVR